MRDRRNAGGEAHSVGKALREMLNTYRLEEKFDGARVEASWEKMVGRPIARRTKKVWFKDHVLYAELDTPAMKQDFQLHKSAVLALFQKEYGAEVVREIVVL